MRYALNFLALCLSFAAFSAAAQQATPADKELMERIAGAAPAAIVDGATVMAVGPDGQMRTVRPGANSWTCMEAAGAPMCADKAAMDWLGAKLSKQAPPQTLGFVYMLNGDRGGSNTDPYATKETPDNNWIVTGPHVMLVGGEAKSMLSAYPRNPKADPTQPYVMWPGTPYEHLMLPIK